MRATRRAAESASLSCEPPRRGAEHEDAAVQGLQGRQRCAAQSRRISLPVLDPVRRDTQARGATSFAVKVALAGWLACALLLGCAERSELCLTASVAAIWLALAPLYGAQDHARAGLLTGCAATPFLGLAAAADHASGASLLEVLGVGLIGLAWSIAVSWAAAASRASARGARFLQLWMFAGLLLPLFSLALGLAGASGRVPAWLMAASAPAWLVLRCSLDAQSSPLDSIASAALPTLALAVAAGFAVKWRSLRSGGARVS